MHNSLLPFNSSFESAFWELSHPIQSETDNSSNTDPIHPSFLQNSQFSANPKSIFDIFPSREFHHEQSLTSQKIKLLTEENVQLKKENSKLEKTVQNLKANFSILQRQAEKFELELKKTRLEKMEQQEPSKKITEDENQGVENKPQEEIKKLKSLLLNANVQHMRKNLIIEGIRETIISQQKTIDSQQKTIEHLTVEAFTGDKKRKLEETPSVDVFFI